MRSSAVVFAFGLLLVSTLGPVALGATGSAPASDDQPVRGTVKAIRGDIVVVDMSNSEWLPIGGNMSHSRSLHIGFEVPGVGVVAGDEKWLVTQINRDSFEILAPSPAALASVRPGYTVLFPRLTGTLQTKAQYDKGHAAYERDASMKWPGSTASLGKYVAFTDAWGIGDFDAALEAAAKIDVVTLDADVAGNFVLGVAEILVARGRLDDAEPHFRKAVALNPKGTAFFACHFFADHHRLDRGREICDTCLRVDPLPCRSIPGVLPEEKGND